MSAMVRSRITGRKTGVIRVPATAVLQSGKEYFCYVKSGQEIDKRQVVPGVRNDGVVAVAQGLKEGEQVLRTHRAASPAKYFTIGKIRRPPAKMNTSESCERTFIVNSRSVACSHPDSATPLMPR